MEEAFMDLSTLRNEIDRIDSQLVQLYEQRMEICSQVAEYKIENGKKVFENLFSMDSFENRLLETLKEAENLVV